MRFSQSWRRTVRVGTAMLVGAAAFSCTATHDENENRASAISPNAGEYVVRIGGCNDCHTPGYAESSGNVPLADWLTGNPVGYRGPWGTTYASNLRLYVAPMSEEDWVKVMRSRNDKPPMPWTSLHAMNDHDLRAIYRFIKSLGPAGGPSPKDVPPGVEPRKLYITMAPPTLPGQGRGK